jgi:hypothetical protein
MDPKTIAPQLGTQVGGPFDVVEQSSFATNLRTGF